MILGFVLGARHALEPDHLAAVSVLANERPGAGRGAVIGAFWGLGHTGALLAVALVLTVLRIGMPHPVAVAFELLVAVMLVFLGARAIRRAFSVEPAARAAAAPPLLVGSIHGLAGSGALTALLVAELPTLSDRLLYTALFGLGSVGGMMILSGLAGWPLAQAARAPASRRLVDGLAGALSLVLGVVWGCQLV